MKLIGVSPQFSRILSVNKYDSGILLTQKSLSGLTSDIVRFSSSQDTPEFFATKEFVDYIVERLRQLLVESDNPQMNLEFLELFDDQRKLEIFKERSVKKLIEDENITFEQLGDMLKELKAVDNPDAEAFNIFMMVNAFKLNFIMNDVKSLTLPAEDI